MRAVADAGPLIHLSWIDRIDLLPLLFEEILVPESVRDEVLITPEAAPGAGALRHAFSEGWLPVRRARGADERLARRGASRSHLPPSTYRIRAAREATRSGAKTSPATR